MIIICSFSASSVEDGNVTMVAALHLQTRKNVLKNCCFIIKGIHENGNEDLHYSGKFY